MLTEKQLDRLVIRTNGVSAEYRRRVKSHLNAERMTTVGTLNRVVSKAMMSRSDADRTKRITASTWNRSNIFRLQLLGRAVRDEVRSFREATYRVTRRAHGLAESRDGLTLARNVIVSGETLGTLVSGFTNQIANDVRRAMVVVTGDSDSVSAAMTRAEDDLRLRFNSRYAQMSAVLLSPRGAPYRVAVIGE